MKSHLLRLASMAAASCALVLSAVPAFAQQQMVTQQTPFTTVNNSFFERIGLNWSLSHPGGSRTGPFSLNFGGFQPATPPFGNFAPGAGVSGGAAFRPGGGWGFNLFGEASQGARSSIVNQTPMVTTMNGIPGFVADQAQSPFVISVVPVVGNGGPFGDFGASNTIRGRLMRGELRSLTQQEMAGTPGTLDFGPPPAIRPIGHNGVPQFEDQGQAIPLRREWGAGDQARDAAQVRPPVKMNRDPLVLRAEPSPSSTSGASGGGRPAGPSSAEQGVASIEEIRRRQAVEREAEAATQRSEAETSLARGKAAEAEGRTGAAKIHYQMALRRAGALKDSSLQAEIAARLDALGGK